MSSWAARTEIVVDELVLRGFTPATDRLLRATDGRHLWIMNPPTERRWTPTGRLASEAPVDWSLVPDRTSTTLRRTPGRGSVAEVDLVEMGPEAAAALRSDTSEPMLVLGSFSPVASPDTLGRFLVGGAVLDTTDFSGHRVPSEQTALSLYRIARWRGGPFWELVAAHIADLVGRRVRTAASGRLVHDLWGHGESHARFVADAALLLLAESERTPDAAHLRGLASNALKLLDEFAVQSWNGVWYRHDSMEVDEGRNDLVLNTHVQAMIVRVAAGLDVTAPMRALRLALSVPPERSRAWLVGHGLRAASLVGAAAPRAGARLNRRLDLAAVHAQQRHRTLAFPGGWVARDASGVRAPGYYLTVNLNDLAGLSVNATDAAVSRALARGIRFARSGFTLLERRQRIPTTGLVPNILRIAGDLAGARRAADRSRRAGVPPAIGWPGYEDDLWERLRAGTP